MSDTIADLAEAAGELRKIVEEHAAQKE